MNVRNAWTMWMLLIVFALGFAAVSFLTSGVAARLNAIVAGSFAGIGMMMWGLGGRVSTSFWRIGAQGERETQKVIDALGPDWHCEHDLEHSHGNFDHVLVGHPASTCSIRNR